MPVKNLFVLLMLSWIALLALLTCNPTPGQSGVAEIVFIWKNSVCWRWIISKGAEVPPQPCLRWGT